MTSLLSGIMVIKNERPRKQKWKKNEGPLFGIPHDGGTGACLKTRKKRQKNYGDKYGVLTKKN